MTDQVVCEQLGAIQIITGYRLRNPTFTEYLFMSSSSSSSPSTSPPLWAAEFFLFTCLLEVPRGLCIGTKRRKPGWAVAEATPKDAVKVLNEQGIREEEEQVDEGLTLWTEEYPELWTSGEMKEGCWLWHSSFMFLSDSHKLSSSLDKALQCSSALSPSASMSSLMEIIEAIGE